jgi:predicted transglutaminase-like cysteine proteinase
MRFLFAVIVAGFAAVAVTAESKAQTQWSGAFERAFGLPDDARSSVAPFAKWQSVLVRAREEETQDASLCRANTAAQVCEYRRSRAEFMQGLRGLAPLEKIAAVNTYVNRVNWVDDQPNYGTPDYWATPDEFFTRGGDCEDFAFAKYDVLKRLGFAADQMRILILTDHKLRQPHAVLLVMFDDRLWVLDNTLRAIAPAEAMQHYEPIYSINESGWWLHRGEPRDVDSAARRR